jgi:hypothetical protein
LVGWLVGEKFVELRAGASIKLVGCLVAWLVDWLIVQATRVDGDSLDVGGLVGWLVKSLLSYVGWLVGWLVAGASAFEVFIGAFGRPRRSFCRHGLLCAHDFAEFSPSSLPGKLSSSKTRVTNRSGHQPPPAHIVAHRITNRMNSFSAPFSGFHQENFN